MEQKQLNNNRYERKYVLPKSIHSKYLNILKYDKNTFIQSYEPRLVHSIYFDTTSLSLAKQNLEGDPVRYKVRMRFYNVFNPRNIFLEIKSRNFDIGNKLILKIDNKNKIINKDSITLSDYQKFFSNFNSLLNKFESFVPILFVSYKRYYFTGLDKKVRVTFDENIGYQNLMENNLYIYKKSIFQYQDNNCIIEIKNPVDQNIEISDIINKLNLRVQRNSKYINGLECINLI